MAEICDSITISEFSLESSIIWEYGWSTALIGFT